METVAGFTLIFFSLFYIYLNTGLLNVGDEVLIALEMFSNKPFLV